jgi:hypothetical protein
MRTSSYWLRRQIASGLVILLAAPFAEIAAEQPQQTPRAQQSQSESSSRDPSQAPDKQAGKPGADASQSEATYPDGPDPVRTQAADQSGQSGTAQSGSEQQQNGAQKPVGTAAAPFEKTTGVAASRPAGAVIAPAKQRRARSILIRVSVIVGAAAAIGTVAALSHGSPSRPN